LFGATYMVLAPEHPLVEQITAAQWPSGIPAVWTGGAATPAEAVADYRRQASRRSDMERQTEGKDKTGVFTGAYAVNPVNGARIPVFIADYVLMGYGTGAIMAVPAEDERDWDFAKAFELPIIRTVQPPEDWPDEAFTGDGVTINSQFLDGLGMAEAKKRMISWLEENGHGRGAVTYKLRDWLFSRQRYWGEPFPIVYGPDGRPRAVPESQLPVVLPEVDDYSPKTYPDDDDTSEPEPPLSRAADWVEVELDLGDGLKKYRRETNTMPNWAGSCWYELRYLDPENSERFVDPEIERYWMGPGASAASGGADLYVGGAEHAVLHLLYARFWHKVLYDLGYVSSAEPFHRLVNQGMVQLPAYTDERGFYVEASEVTEADGVFYHHGQKVNREFGKIGKSLKNVVTPDGMIADYGADTFRLYEMFTGPLDASRPWDAKAVSGMHRLLQRIWRSIIDEDTGEVQVSDEPVDVETRRLLHRTIVAVREGMETLRFNTSIARITELSNRLTQAYADAPTPREAAEPLVLMLAPLAPHIAEELWSRLGHGESLAWTPFPVADPAQLVEESIEIAVQVNGKVRATITIPADASKEQMASLAQADPHVAAQLDGKTIRKVIAVPGRLVSFVVG
jgi:leucyl-tRNA synthetase